MSWWYKVRKITRLPGARLAPETVLASSLEKSEHIKSVYVSIEWRDGTLSADWSSMPRAALAAHAILCQSNALSAVTSDDSTR